MPRLIALALLLAALAGCGFHMRGSDGSYTLPFASIYLGFAENSALGVELRRHIRATPRTVVVSDPAQAQARVEVLAETRDKTILSLNSQGRVREYALVYALRFRVVDRAGAELLAPTDITLRRSINFNEAQVLAKEAEEALLYRDMQSDLVQQIMRRLAALPTAAAPTAAPTPSPGANPAPSMTVPTTAAPGVAVPGSNTEVTTKPATVPAAPAVGTQGATR